MVGFHREPSDRRWTQYTCVFPLSVGCLDDAIRFAVLYGFSLAYLVAPGTFDSAHVIEFVAGLPDYVKTSAKVVLAAPFAFHGWNGIRHLAWDMGKCVSTSAFRCAGEG